MTTPAAHYWTDADEAELDALLHELADAVFTHREAGCHACVNGDYCPKVRAGVEVVVRWRERRRLLSRARHLRLAEELRDVQRQLADLRSEETAAS